MPIIYAQYLYWYWYLKVRYWYLYWYLDHWYWYWYWYLFVEYLIQDCVSYSLFRIENDDRRSSDITEYNQFVAFMTLMANYGNCKMY